MKIEPNIIGVKKSMAMAMVMVMVIYRSGNRCRKTDLEVSMAIRERLRRRDKLNYMISHSEQPLHLSRPHPLPLCTQWLQPPHLSKYGRCN